MSHDVAPSAFAPYRHDTFMDDGVAEGRLSNVCEVAIPGLSKTLRIDLNIAGDETIEWLMQRLEGTLSMIAYWRKSPGVPLE